MGSSKANDPSEFFGGANMGEFMALVFTELTELAECVRIGPTFDEWGIEYEEEDLASGGRR
jgi:hypothetical protein